MGDPNASQSMLDQLSLDPQVKENDPVIPLPDPVIKKQGLECQKLGSQLWNKIRYKEVQKKLQAAPVFDTLKVNPHLLGFGSKVLRTLHAG